MLEFGNDAPRQVTPGIGFAVVVPSTHRFHLPSESPGWTHGWLIIAHPYLVERISRQIAVTGPILKFDAKSVLIRRAVNLICSSYRKELANRFEVERALFEFLVDFEQHISCSSDPSGDRDRLLAEVQEWVLANPTQCNHVDRLAAEYKMSRSNFSHYFRTRTGMTPARVILEARVQEAARRLTATDAPVKQVALDCGFANPNHFIRVFQRVKHLSPGAYRRAVR